MSFSEITKDYSARTEQIVIEFGGKEYKFIAKQLPYIRIQEIGIREMNGDAGHLRDLIVSSIVDEVGDHMTIEQANALPDDVATKMLLAALRVNNAGTAEKN